MSGDYVADYDVEALEHYAALHGKEAMLAMIQALIARKQQSLTGTFAWAHQYPLEGTHKFAGMSLDTLLQLQRMLQQS